MADPLGERELVNAALRLAADEAHAYLAALDDAIVLDPGTEAAVEAWSDPMPEDGHGAMATLTELAQRGRDAATRSSGPRFFHFVMGGGTPAALGADWLTSTYDQVAYTWASSPFAMRLEQVAIDWLRQLFELPEGFGGVLTSGATMANFVGLASARSWWAEQLGVDVDADGLSGLPPATILTSGYVHPSAVQAIGMLGLGRSNVRRLGTGPLDLAAFEDALRGGQADRGGDARRGGESGRGGDASAGGSGPAIVILNAGEVNAGDFDPIPEAAALAKEHGAWLHVDGAFGLFARVAPSTRALTDGVELANSVTCDGHKWLNVPYDCGFAFVRDPSRVPRTLNVGAPYLPGADDPHPNFGFMSPESSRRARALAVWATLRAYGRTGYREMVERHLALAQRLAARVDDAPDLERLADVPLNIVCFRAHPPGVDDEGELDALNLRLGDGLRADGRVIAGTTTYEGRAALRPAIVNWRTTEDDVDLLVDVVHELI